MSVSTLSLFNELEELPIIVPVGNCEVAGTSFQGRGSILGVKEKAKAKAANTVGKRVMML